MVEFSDLLEDLKLIDLQQQDWKFTWFKGDNLDIASRIDRFLISEDLGGSFSNMNHFTLQRMASDHSPVALQGGVLD